MDSEEAGRGENVEGKKTEIQEKNGDFDITTLSNSRNANRSEKMTLSRSHIGTKVSEKGKKKKGKLIIGNLEDTRKNHGQRRTTTSKRKGEGVSECGPQMLDALHSNYDYNYISRQSKQIKKEEGFAKPQ